MSKYRLIKLADFSQRWMNKKNNALALTTGVVQCADFSCSSWLNEIYYVSLYLPNGFLVPKHTCTNRERYAQLKEMTMKSILNPIIYILCCTSFNLNKLSEK